MPKIVNKEEMQAGIMSAAMSVFAKKGFRAATIADIADAAGLGKGTLYLYFKNKDAMVEAMVEHHFKGFALRVQNAPMPDTLEDFTSALNAAMDVPDEHADFIRVFFEVFGAQFASEGFTAKIRHFFDSIGAEFGQRIAHLQALGRVNETLDAVTTGRVLASMVDGMVLHRGLVGVDRKTYAGQRAAAIKVLLDGMAPTP